MAVRQIQRLATMTHPWLQIDPSAAPQQVRNSGEALALQRTLASRIQLGGAGLNHATRIAGVDVGFPRGRSVARAAAVVLDYPSLRPVEVAIAEEPVEFPYVPGLLSFRELPAILSALSKLARSPDLILCDGQGIAHPRQLGIASHLGIAINLPTIGVGKSRLTGSHAPVGVERGARTPLLDRHGLQIGTVLRTRSGTKPLYVSPGHRIDHDAAVEWVLRATPRYRLPETTRQADRLASAR